MRCIRWNNCARCRRRDLATPTTNSKWPRHRLRRLADKIIDALIGAFKAILIVEPLLYFNIAGKPRGFVQAFLQGLIDGLGKGALAGSRPRLLDGEQGFDSPFLVGIKPMAYRMAMNRQMPGSLAAGSYLTRADQQQKMKTRLDIVVPLMA